MSSNNFPEKSGSNHNETRRGSNSEIYVFLMDNPMSSTEMINGLFGFMDLSTKEQVSQSLQSCEETVYTILSAKKVTNEQALRMALVIAQLHLGLLVKDAIERPDMENESHLQFVNEAINCAIDPTHPNTEGLQQVLDNIGSARQKDDITSQYISLLNPYLEPNSSIREARTRYDYDPSNPLTPYKVALDS